MGEMAEMFLNGEYCEQCGDYLGGNCGHPRCCSACSVGHEDRMLFKRPTKTRCEICGKLVKKVGLEQHMKAKHE